MQTILIDLPENVKNFLLMEDSVYKNILWNRDFRAIYVKCDIFKTDEKLCFSSKEYVIAKSKTSFYLRPKSNKGFTHIYKGKVNLWFGSTVNDMVNLPKLFEFLGFNWIESFMYSYLTKGGLEKILNGKITNPVDFCKAYLKSNRINASPSLMYKACKDKGLGKNTLLLYSNNSKDVNHFFERLLANYNFDSIWNDSIQQAMLLGVKVDCLWSDKRIKEEHTKWTKELMQAEIHSIPNVSIPKLDLIPELPVEFELLSTQKRVFEEGMLMKHCIYTNYWPTILKGEYIAFHIKYKNEEATLGAYWYKTGLQFSQLYQRYNTQVSNEMDIFVKDWFNNNKDKFKIEPKSEEVGQLAYAC